MTMQSSAGNGLLVVLALWLTISVCPVRAAQAGAVVDGCCARVPLRGVCEALGAEVQWWASTRAVVILRTHVHIVMQVDLPTAWVNGEPTPLKAPPVLRNGQVLVPLRFVAEALGARVNYRGTYVDIAVPGAQTLQLRIRSSEASP